jgi:filamentous hemagglutinin
VSIAPGTLQGQGVTADTGGAFVLDTKSLDPAQGAPMSYGALAAILDAGGFTQSWNIRARTGDISITGLSQARSVMVSADGADSTTNPDTGNIDVSGTIDASGDTPGTINIWAGNNLIVEATAFLNAHAASANANGVGGQVWLGAGGAGKGTGMLTVTVGARIDVGFDALNSGVSAPVFTGPVTLIAAGNSYGASSVSSLNITPTIAVGTTYTCVTQLGLGLAKGQAVAFVDSTGNSIAGTVSSYNPATGALAVAVTGENAPSLGGQVTLSTARNAAETGVNLAVAGGSFANFAAGITGESAWDGLVMV